jgi:hypothetical protein
MTAQKCRQLRYTSVCYFKCLCRAKALVQGFANKVDLMACLADSSGLEPLSPIIVQLILTGRHQRGKARHNSESRRPLRVPSSSRPYCMLLTAGGQLVLLSHHAVHPRSLDPANVLAVFLSLASPYCLSFHAGGFDPTRGCPARISLNPLSYTFNACCPCEGDCRCRCRSRRFDTLTSFQFHPLQLRGIRSTCSMPPAVVAGRAIKCIESSRSIQISTEPNYAH